MSTMFDPKTFTLLSILPRADKLATNNEQTRLQDETAFIESAEGEVLEAQITLEAVKEELYQDKKVGAAILENHRRYTAPVLVYV